MASTQPFASANRPETLTKAIHEYWYLLLAQGIILSILGLAAIIVPPLAGLVTTFFVALMLFAGGIVGLVSAIWGRRMPGFWWSPLSAIAAIIAGGIMIWNPAIGLISLTSLLIVYFIVNGVLAIVLSLQIARDSQAAGCGSLLTASSIW